MARRSIKFNTPKQLDKLNKLKDKITKFIEKE